MRVGIIKIEPTVVNTACMQIAAAHRGAGDSVEWALPLEYDQFDRLYCSSLFTFTPKKTIPAQTICGGTGFNLKAKLPGWIDRAGYDYSIYPECDYSIVRFSRGCVRRCRFCVVPEKEGGIKPVEVKNLNPKGKRIVVQDNNFFASPLWYSAIGFLNEIGQPVDFQGVDVWEMTTRKLQELSRVPLAANQAVKIAWDWPKQEISSVLRRLLGRIPANKIMCYVLIGYDSTPEQDLHRVRTLWDRYRVRPYVMSYNENSPYQSAFERWVNSHIYKNTRWAEYKYRKEFDEGIDRGRVTVKAERKR